MGLRPSDDVPTKSGGRLPMLLLLFMLLDKFSCTLETGCGITPKYLTSHVHMCVYTCIITSGPFVRVAIVDFRLFFSFSKRMAFYRLVLCFGLWWETYVQMTCLFACMSCFTTLALRVCFDGVE